jgi:hypothetical protein
VIADRHVFVVWQQRIVGAEQLASIGRVVNAGKEVGVVADRRGQLEAACIGAVNEPRAQRLVTGAVRPIGIEYLAKPTPQRKPCVAAKREYRIQRRAGRGPRGVRSKTVEQSEFERRGEIEDVVPDGDAAAGRAIGWREHAERQVLDRKVGVMVRRGNPASPPR